MSASTDQPICLYCRQTAEQIPLIQINFRRQELWICPQHLPILIHKPEQLVDKLPGLPADLQAADHD